MKKSLGKCLNFSAKYSVGIIGKYFPVNFTSYISSLDFSIECTENANKNQNYFWHVAAFKTGSTWLDRLLKDMYPFQTFHLDNFVGTRQLNPIKLLLYSSLPSKRKILFSQQFCLNTRLTEKYLEKSKCKVILQCRNINDSIVSLYDHSNLSPKDDFWVFFGYNERIWLNLTEEQKLDFLVDCAAPWYFAFYASWLSSNIINSDQIIVVPYEKLKKDTSGELNKINNWGNLNICDNDINKATEGSDTGFTRKNKGIVGRGKTTLSEEQKNRIKRYANYYNNVDFKKYGILDE